MTTNQAIKIATMMLQAATYQKEWIELRPIITRREGREETYAAIAKALALLTGANEQEVLEQLEWCNGHNCMELRVGEDMILRLRNEYQNAPVYQDSKGRQYIMYEGVRTQDYSYQVIDVARYIDLQPTGKYRNIEKLQKAINRKMRQYELEALEDYGIIDEKTDEEYSKIEHLYR